MNRINIGMKQIILLLALVAATGAQARVHFDRLRCEYQTLPLDVDTQHPRFTTAEEGGEAGRHLAFDVGYLPWWQLDSQCPQLRSFTSQ